ncbi:TM0996/MTH895 family glutaredoxin-like protein [bacterium]|nr:TM0996/MTH895 family glutaredoxin-like protein [bacterium]
MKIEILGTGCPKCKKLTENVEAALEESGLQAELVKISDIEDILSYGVMLTPALGINGDVITVGQVPNSIEIKGILLKIIDRQSEQGKH